MRRILLVCIGALFLSSAALGLPGNASSAAPSPSGAQTGPSTGASAAPPSASAMGQAAAAPLPGSMTLKEASSRLKAKLSWDPVTASGSFSASGITASFALDSGWALFDWSDSVAIDPPQDGPKGPMLSARTLALFEKRFSDAETKRKGHFSIAAILIDPGHGGKDSGAVGDHVIDGKKLHVVEKDLALDVAKRVHAALALRFPDKRILISRSGDSYPTLDDRVQMANDVGLDPDEAIIYVSIHANASFNKNAKGFEVWYLNPDYRRTLVKADGGKGTDKNIAPILNAMLEEEFTTESIMLARKIMEGLQADIGGESPSRGIRAEEWFVVRNARMPSVLVEMGFVTNPDEARLLAGDDYLKRLSDGIYTGIVDFVGYFETMRGPPTP